MPHFLFERRLGSAGDSYVVLDLERRELRGLTDARLYALELAERIVGQIADDEALSEGGLRVTDQAGKRLFSLPFRDFIRPCSAGGS